MGHVHKVIDSRSWSQEQKGPKYIFPWCKTSIGSNSDYIKHRAMKCAYSMDSWLWQIEWCHRHLCQVTSSETHATKCMQSCHPYTEVWAWLRLPQQQAHLVTEGWWKIQCIICVLDSSQGHTRSISILNG